ncbi:MAG: hypothetical protein JNM68_09500, partial [Dinghuibacter sp.]|nr:hypothetical protein [Dinghuibacter sp.]
MKYTIKYGALLAGLMCAGQIMAQNTFPATGNAGIGTTSPLNKLHIETNGLYQGVYIRHNNGYWSQYIGGSFAAGGYNGITRDNDAGIIFGGASINNASGFVLAPWASLSAGLRMSNTGQTTIYTGTLLGSFDVQHSNSYWVKTHAGSLSTGSYNGISQLNDAGIIFGGTTIGAGPAFVIAPWANATSGLRIQNNGAVQVGNVATPAGYKLYVDTGILTEKVTVAVRTSADWADHVFNKNYPLMPLEQVDIFIKKNGHLPGIPAAAEMVKEGNDLGKTDALLLEKIEELTLHLVEQN